MAQRTVYSKARPDPARGRRPSAFNAQAEMSAIHENFAVLGDDSIGTKFYFGRVASSAIVLPNSILHHTGITSATLNIGFEDPRGVIAAQPAVLASALNIAAAGTKQINAAVAVANLNKRVWELLGLPNDPGQELDLVGTLAAAATLAGNLSVFVHIGREG